MSKAILKYYFIGIGLLAIALVFFIYVNKGIYKQELTYICTAIASTFTLYAYLLNRETFGRKISLEIGLTFIVFITFWFFSLLVLMLWRATDIFANSIDKDELSYYFGGLEIFKALVLTTMIPKIFPANLRET